MSEYALVCNYKKCRNPINSYAWVTSCSHAFCDNHSHEQEWGRKCAACDSVFNGKYDIVKADLNPSEEFKSMILAGLRPEIILDIASRAISFWSHQMYKEKLIHYSRANSVEAQLNHVESSYETLIVKMKNDIEAKNKNFETLKTQFADQTQRVQELENYLSKKDRQLQALQVKYESARRETLTATIAQQEHKSPTCRSHLIDRINSPKFISQQGMLQVPSNHCNLTNSHQGVMHHCHQSGHHQRVCVESASKMTFADKPFEFNPTNQEAKPKSPSCNPGFINKNNTFQFD
ncbi:hypothetical protein LSTR_LSTR011056 [Laodelphax striatellus]|uniref:RING-type domain-containing protein n=1 Tax=Laodelphax striatellus TaxID=195883 RepID=A0A482WGE8_LAOST|nr:hypothetical protein LSTR_LSTR011056 [Laodelphax striatellus]